MINTSLIRKLINEYGATAFGLVCLIVVWFVIVNPFMEDQRAMTIEHLEISRNLEETAESLERILNQEKDCTNGNVESGSQRQDF